MLKGCKHYFTMFGMFLHSINLEISKFLSRINEQTKKSIFAKKHLNILEIQSSINKQQTYQ